MSGRSAIVKPSVPSKFSKTPRPKKSKSKPKGTEALQSVKKARKLEKEILKKNKKKDVHAKSGRRIKERRRPNPTSNRRP